MFTSNVYLKNFKRGWMPQEVVNLTQSTGSSIAWANGNLYFKQSGVLRELREDVKWKSLTTNTMPFPVQASTLLTSSDDSCLGLITLGANNMTFYDTSLPYPWTRSSTATLVSPMPSNAISGKGTVSLSGQRVSYLSNSLGVGNGIDIRSGVVNWGGTTNIPSVRTSAQLLLQSTVTNANMYRISNMAEDSDWSFVIDGTGRISAPSFPSLPLMKEIVAEGDQMFGLAVGINSSNQLILIDYSMAHTLQIGSALASNVKSFDVSFEQGLIVYLDLSSRVHALSFNSDGTTKEIVVNGQLTNYQEVLLDKKKPYLAIRRQSVPYLQIFKLRK